MAQSYDAIIIGGGHNGLVTAAYLGRAGKRVLVLERRDRVGGAAVTEEIYPGFKFSVFSYVVSLLRPEIIRDLDLPQPRPRAPSAGEHADAVAERQTTSRPGPTTTRPAANSTGTPRATRRPTTTSAS